MDLYHIWCDLKPGERDVEFVEHVGRYLGRLRDDGLIAGFRLTRRKLGLGAPGLGEFHVMIETQDLAQLERAFQTVSARADPVESLHHAVNSRVQNFQAALYRDFPDPHRRAGEEKF
jgi:hypothetical protein